jgi:hypothetical protein
MIRQFNLQSSECCLPPWKLELTDGALEDILCVRREEMTQNMCGITSNHGGIYRMGMKFEFFKKIEFFGAQKQLVFQLKRSNLK